MFKFILILSFLFVQLIGFAQGFPQNPMQPGGGSMQGGGFDSSEVSRDSARVLIFDKFIIDHIASKKHLLKKDLDLFQLYQPVFRFQSFNSTLGNTGQAIYHLNQSKVGAFGFHYGLIPYQAYALTHHDAIFYEAQSPFTEAFYVLGSAQEQFFRVIHTQNITPNLNIGLHYQRITSDGLYNSQRTNHTAFRLFSSYFSPNRRYTLLASTSINDLRAQENGGITALGDTLFRENVEQNRTILPVELGAASNQSFQNGFALKHAYRFTSDSSDFKLSVFQNLSYDFHRFTFEDEQRPEFYYPAVLDESMISTDHYERKWNNEVGIHLNLDKMLKDSVELQQRVSFGIGQQFVDLNMPRSINGLNNDTSIVNNFISVQYQASWGELIALSSQYKQMYGGANLGDFVFLNRATIHLSSWLALLGEFNLQNREQYYFFNHFAGNHSYWLNNFSKSQQVFFKATVWLKKLDVLFSLEQNTLTNPVVLSEQLQPVQFNEAVNVTAAHLNWQGNFKKIFFNTDLSYQIISGSDAVRLPNIYGRGGIYYKGFFKKKTEIRLGTDLFYISGFDAMQYVPFLGNFALQNNHRSSVQMMADIYLSAKIKRARFFAKLEHANAGLNNFNYILVQGYPLNDRVFRLGLSWMFFD